MSDPTTTTVAASPSGKMDSRAALTPEMVRELSQRVSLGALLYAGVWTLAYGFFAIQAYMGPADGHRPDLFDHAIYVLSVGMAFLVYRTTRRGECPPEGLARMAMAFMILGSLFIAAGAWGGGKMMAEDFARLGAAVDVTGHDGLVALADRLEARNVNLFHTYGGTTWVGVWMLAFPFIYPMSPRRITIAALVSAATVPGVIILALLVQGSPETVGRWIDNIIIDMTVPTFICAGLTIAIASRMYALTRDLARAREMGSYELVERIGTGGMGEVWRARHRMLVRPAAIKLIKPEALGGDAASSGAGVPRGIRPRSDSSASTTALKRFEREAQATAALTSPNTIEIYDFGVTENGSFYYVMELLDGLDLSSLVETHGPVPPARALHFLHQACHSLHDAHTSGLVHRDVKPANLFTCRRGPDLDVIKVLDFGLVKEADTRPGGTRLTMEGSTTGTPAFMAPEMVYGHDRVDARADIYALGCVAYWLLTGVLVFEGESPMAVLVQHAKDAPAPPSERASQPVPKDLERIILDCLAKDPDARPQTAAELSARLAACEGFGAWTADDAAAWWQAKLPETKTAGAPSEEAPAASAV